MSDPLSSDELEPGVVLPKLLKAIEADGEMSDHERDQIVLVAITSLYQIIIPFIKRIKRLEDRSIVSQAINHPKIAGVVFLVFLLFVMFVHQISPWVMKNIAFLAGFR